MRSKRHEARSEAKLPGAHAAGGEECERALNEEIMERAIARMNELQAYLHVEDEERHVDEESDDKALEAATPQKIPKSPVKPPPKRPVCGPGACGMHRPHYTPTHSDITR